MSKKFTLALFLYFFVSETALTQSVIKMSSDAGGPAGNGPVLNNQTITLYNGATPSSITVEYSIVNQQFPPGTVEGMPTAYGTYFAGQNSGVNTAIGTGNAIFPVFGQGSPTSGQYTACLGCTAGTGIVAGADRGVTISAIMDALIDAAGNNTVATSATTHFSDITLFFNRPVSNPVIHLSGLGGLNGALGMSAELELITTIYTLQQLSGSTYFDVSGNLIRNTASLLGANQNPPTGTRYGAGGSVAVVGTNITSLTFRLYVKGDGGAGFYSGVGNVTAETFSMAVSLQLPTTVSGNVFYDPDGGLVNNSSGVANNVPAGMSINILDVNSLVVATAPVNTDGSYSLPNIGEGTYTAVLTSIPSTWGHTGGFIGEAGVDGIGNDGNRNGRSVPFTVAGSNLEHLNFGIELKPLADEKEYTLPATPVADTYLTLDGGGNASTGSIPGILTGVDPEDGILNSTTAGYSVVIDALPTNGTLWYDGATVAAGDTIASYDPALLQLQFTGAGYNTTTFYFSVVDFADVKSEQQSYTISWEFMLPVKLGKFDVEYHNNVTIKWTTLSENLNKGFFVERSVDNQVWSSLGFVASLTATGNSHSTLSYQYLDTDPQDGINYYRLKQVDFDGKFEYSVVKHIRVTAGSGVDVYPNPATNHITIDHLAAGQIVRIFNLNGKLVKHLNTTAKRLSIPVSDLSNGVYVIQIVDSNQRLITKKIVVARQ